MSSLCRALQFLRTSLSQQEDEGTVINLRVSLWIRMCWVQIQFDGKVV